MSENHEADARVVAVLLADGWHRIAPGSFRVGPLSFEAEAGPGTPGFRFEEADAGRPYQPTVLADPLASIIAVRQVTPGRGTSATRTGQGQCTTASAQIKVRGCESAPSAERRRDRQTA